MSKRQGPKTRLRAALDAVIDRIDKETNRDSKYSRGLAREGYLGGYADALSDVQLLLNGVVPCRREFWLEPE